MKLDAGAFADLVALARAAIDGNAWDTLNKPGEWIDLQALLDALPQLKITLEGAPSLSCRDVNTLGTTTGKTTVFRVGSHDIKVPGEWLSIEVQSSACVSVRSSVCLLRRLLPAGEN